MRTKDWIVLGFELAMMLALVTAVIVSTIRFKRVRKNKGKKQ